MSSRHIAVLYPSEVEANARAAEDHALIRDLAQAGLIHSGVILDQAHQDRDYEDSLAVCQAIYWPVGTPPEFLPLPVFTEVEGLDLYLRQQIAQTPVASSAPQTAQAARQAPSTPARPKVACPSGDAVGDLQDALAVLIATGLNKTQTKRVAGMLKRFVTVYPDCTP